MLLLIKRASSKQGKNSNDDDGKSDRRSDVYRISRLSLDDELSDVFIFLTTVL